MDYSWYFPNRNGDGGGTVIVEGTDYNTITIPVLSSEYSTECSINDIDPTTFGYSVQAFSVENGTEEETRVQTLLNFESLTAIFQFSWNTAFSGYININYWTKTS